MLFWVSTLRSGHFFKFLLLPTEGKVELVSIERGLGRELLLVVNSYTVNSCQKTKERPTAIKVTEIDKNV